MGTQEVASELQEIFFYCEGDWAVGQVGQKCGGDSMLGDIQKLFYCGPGQLVRDGHG